jgi:hypothetical protein
MGVGGQRHAPAALPQGKTRYPLYRRMGGPQDRSGRVRKNLTPSAIRSPDCPARRESLYRMRYPDLQYTVPFPIEMHRTDKLSSCHYWVKKRNVAVGYVWTLVYVRRTEPKIQKHRCKNLRTWQIETPVHQTAECPPHKRTYYTQFNDFPV